MNGIHSMLRRADARGSCDTISPYITHIATLRVRHSYCHQKVGDAYRIFDTNR